MSRSPARFLSRALSAALVLGLSLGAVSGSDASLRSKVKDVRRKLVDLGHRVTEEERAVARVEGRLALLRSEIVHAREQIALTEARVRESQAAVDAAEARLNASQARLDALARAAFIDQPGGEFGTFLSVVLGSESISDVYDGLEFSGRAAEPIASLLHKIEVTKAALDAELASRQALESRQASLLQQLRARRDERRQTVQQGKGALRSLRRTRTQIIGLARKLFARWRLKMFPILGTVFQGPGHTSFGRWSVSFLRALEAPECRANEAVLIAWQLTEFTQASWNPLATTTRMPGSTDFNDAGVQNFVSLRQGVAATKQTLGNGAFGYGSILANLEAGSSPMATARAIRDSAWCGNCSNGGYVTLNVPRVLADFRLYASF